MKKTLNFIFEVLLVFVMLGLPIWVVRVFNFHVDGPGMAIIVIGWAFIFGSMWEKREK